MILSDRLARRHRQAEVMDQPDLEPARHQLALRGLERINFWSGSAGILWPAVRTALQQADQPLRLLDVATGAGDVPVRLWHKTRRVGLPLEVAGCDRSPTALDYARRQAEQKQAGVTFFTYDVLREPLPAGYDIITCSLFLHHLEETEAVQLLRHMGHAAGRLVLVSDLARGRLGYLLAYAGTRLLSRSDVVHTDGPLSVESAFRPEEARRLAERAGLGGARVARHWPCRWLLTWERA